jgi:hypothetical protein
VIVFFAFFLCLLNKRHQLLNIFFSGRIRDQHGFRQMQRATEGVAYQLDEESQENRISRRAALQRRNREDHHPGKDEVTSLINVPLKLDRRLFE